MGEDVDSTASEARTFEACATCGAPFVQGKRYPVRTTEDAEGNIQVHSFCDEDCIGEWSE